MYNKWIYTESCDNTPDEKPYKAAHEDGIASPHITEAAEYEESAGDNERKRCSGPYAGRLWDIKVSYQSW